MTVTFSFVSDDSWRSDGKINISRENGGHYNGQLKMMFSMVFELIQQGDEFRSSKTLSPGSVDQA